MHCIGSDEEDSQAGEDIASSGRVWECIGPFPAGMREHPMTCSSLHAFGKMGCDADIAFSRAEYDEEETWPSQLADGGRVGWKRFEEDDEGWTSVKYPDIRWSQLRSDHGWASLQYQTMLRTPIAINDTKAAAGTSILVDARQAVEYAFVRADYDAPVIWHSGDMYDFAGSPTGHRGGSCSQFSSNFARSICLPPGDYMMLVRAIYEMRLFGDPGLEPPTIRFKLSVEMDPTRDELVFIDGLAIVPDVVDGKIMGQWMSVGLRVPCGREDVNLQSISCNSKAMRLELPRPTTMISGQTRRIACRIVQIIPFLKIDTLNFSLRWRGASSRSDNHSEASLPMRQRTSEETFKFTFPSPVATTNSPPAQVGYAMAVPPTPHARLPRCLKERSMKDIPVILALHGAGVDVEWKDWLEAMPITGSWSVLPTGKNEWGEDWHGASMADAWSARDALAVVLETVGITVSDQTLLIGHSNGGQGAWHLASHYPDRIVGVIGAAGYLKIQDYVPFTEFTASHHADPALMGVLSASLSPYNNDLYLSNLVHVPCLALHGGADTNVPPRHSRAYADIVSSWQHDKSAVEVVEVEGKDHWWDGMMRHPQIAAFIQRVIESGKRSWEEERRSGYTLTTACPDESGGRAGIRIAELETPGRLARLDVNAPHWRNGTERPGLDIRGMNVKRIEFTSPTGAAVSLDGRGRPVEQSYPTSARVYGPMIRLLSSPAALLFVVGPDPQHRQLALRLAHDIFVHHRLDSTIVSAEEALTRVARGGEEGNIVTIGTPFENTFSDWLMRQRRIQVRFPAQGIMEVNGKLVYEAGAGIITLHPHPTSPKGLAALIAGNDEAGLLTAARLFPLRTGVQVPDWAVVGPRMSWQAAGGLIGAGFWNGEWKYSDAMSWFDR